MSAAVLALLLLVAGVPAGLARLRTVTARAPGRDSWVPPAAQLLALGAAGLLAALARAPGPVLLGVVQVAGVLAAAAGAGPVVRAVFRVAHRTHPGPPPVQELLRGGAVIGVLERVAVAATLLAGFPEGLPVVLAVKALARYPELREAKAGEQFIIGTFTSVLWASACWATVRALAT